MKRIGNRFIFDRPIRRPLRIYASDPMATRLSGNRARVDVETEWLRPGPVGERVEVIDFDGGTGRFYPPVDLDDHNVLMHGGLDPSESDPRFHQQMVYAVAMRTLEHFDRALGRVIYLGRSASKPRLRIFPHAFYGANAFYDRKLNSILFGYFRASDSNPGPNLPGQTVFTCLSHDIISHEMTHAIVDRLRRYFLEPTNEDVLAFHEGFADIVALFQHFQHTEIVRDQIRDFGYDLENRELLMGLGQQFGYASGSGTSLRSAIGKRDATLNNTSMEPHARGAILVAAVFDAFLTIYRQRVRDMLRIAGRENMRPDQEMPFELAGRFAVEAWRVAQAMLRMCIRAFDYLPPVDISFGDYLRALVTADLELSPDDESGQRGAIIEAFRLRGIYPNSVRSLAEESLVWDPIGPGVLRDIDIPPALLLRAFTRAATRLTRGRDVGDFETQSSTEQFGPVYSTSAEMNEPDEDEIDMESEMASALNSFAQANAQALSLVPNLPIEVHGFHPVFRVSAQGRLLIELVVQFAQTDRSTISTYGGIPLRGGTTVIARADGVIRYVITKPLPSNNLNAAESARGEARVARLKRYMEWCDLTDPMTPYYEPTEFKERMQLRMNLRALHSGDHA